MDVLVQTDLLPLLRSPRSRLASVGAALALAGLLIAVAAPAFLEAKERPPTDLPHMLAQSAHKIKDRLAHKELQVQAQRTISWKAVLAVGAAMIGFLGAALGTASWARREKWRLSGIAIAAGLTAIAWNYFIAAAIAAIGLFLMAWVVSHFHR